MGERRVISRRCARIALALLALLTLGCVTQAKRDVYRDGGIEVWLRSQERPTSTVERHFSHPLTVSPVRMAHILSRLDIRVGTEKDRVAAIPTDILYPVAEGVSKALAEATPDEVVIAQSVAKTKRMYVFDRTFLTNFLVYARGEQIFIHLSRSEWPIPNRRKETLPEPEIGVHPMDFKLFAGTAMSLVDRQSVMVDWRDPIFREPTRTRITAGGEVIRKTILMESPAEDWVENDESDTAEIFDGLTANQLRALGYAIE